MALFQGGPDRHSELQPESHRWGEVISGSLAFPLTSMHRQTLMRVTHRSALRKHNPKAQHNSDIPLLEWRYYHRETVEESGTRFDDQTNRRSLRDVQVMPSRPRVKLMVYCLNTELGFCIFLLISHRFMEHRNQQWRELGVRMKASHTSLSFPIIQHIWISWLYL